MVDQRNRWIELEGVIVIAEQDRRGKVLEIALETGSFETVLFSGRGKSKELMSHLNQKVHIEGTVEGKDYYGRVLVTVEQYHFCDAVSSV